MSIRSIDAVFIFLYGNGVFCLTKIENVTYFLEFS